MTSEAQKRTYKKWVENNREKVREINRNWRQNHKEQFKDMVIKRRKDVAEQLKAKGTMFTYLPRTQRELRNINYVMRMLNINEDQARELLIKYNWNTVQIIKDFPNKKTE